MLRYYVSCGDPRALDVCVQLFRLNDPLVGIERVILTAEGADLILLSWRVSVSKGLRQKACKDCFYLHLFPSLRYKLQFLCQTCSWELGSHNVFLWIFALCDEPQHSLAYLALRRLLWHNAEISSFELTKLTKKRRRVLRFDAEIKLMIAESGELSTSA